MKVIMYLFICLILRRELTEIIITDGITQTEILFAIHLNSLTRVKELIFTLYIMNLS